MRAQHQIPYSAVHQAFHLRVHRHLLKRIFCQSHSLFERFRLCGNQVYHFLLQSQYHLHRNALTTAQALQHRTLCFTSRCRRMPHKADPVTMQLSGKLPLLVLPAAIGRPFPSLLFSAQLAYSFRSAIGARCVDGVCWLSSYGNPGISRDSCCFGCLGGVPAGSFTIDNYTLCVPRCNTSFPNSIPSDSLVLSPRHSISELFPSPLGRGATSRLAGTRFRRSSGSLL